MTVAKGVGRRTVVEQGLGWPCVAAFCDADKGKSVR